jgi:hypothetical protein
MAGKTPPFFRFGLPKTRLTKLLRGALEGMKALIK